MISKEINTRILPNFYRT